MKRVGMILLCLVLCIGLVGCDEKPSQPAKDIATTTSTTTTTTTTTTASSYLSDDALAAVVAPLLGMPDDESITYDMKEIEYWESAGREVRFVRFFQNGIWCGGAAVDPVTGELMRNIMEYFDPTDPTTNPNASLCEKLNSEIENAYVLERSYPENQSTGGMVDVSNKYTAKWAEIADEYYQKIMAHELEEPNETYGTSEDLHTFVSNMKASWEEYYAVQCENYQEVLLTIYGGGTLVHPVFADYQYDMQKDWALRLVTIYERL